MRKHFWRFIDSTNDIVPSLWAGATIFFIVDFGILAWLIWFRK